MWLLCIYMGQVDVEIVTASVVSVIFGLSFSHSDRVSGQVCAATRTFPSMARITSRMSIMPIAWIYACGEFSCQYSLDVQVANKIPVCTTSPIEHRYCSARVVFKFSKECPFFVN